MILNKPFSRRQFVTGAVAGAATLGLSSCSSLTSFGNQQPIVHKKAVEIKGNNFHLDLNTLPVNFTGKSRMATAINGSIPAPTLRWQEGETVTLTVKNHMAVDSSIHWHGMILPTEMDGVPGLSFDGIKPGESFTYQFKINQSGTYWYHSHSGFQEQTGMYGAIIIDPKKSDPNTPDPVSYDSEHVVLLSDWSDETPEHVYATLKKMSHYYNFRERTMTDLWQDIKSKGVSKTWQERAMWNDMRMSDTDIADVTGYTYTYLMNGVTPDAGWKGLFANGEKVRLRFINGSAMTIFDVRIPGLKMTVVASDGQNIQPVSVDEFRIGVAETYDVIVEPESDSAYTIFAQSIDRSGYTRGTLAAHESLTAEVPSMDYAPILGHRDMGMSHGSHHGSHAPEETPKPQSRMAMDAQHMHGDHSNHDDHDMHKMHSQHTDIPEHKHHETMQKQTLTSKPLGKAGMGSNNEIIHAPSTFGPHVDMRADTPVSGLHDPGVGLRNHHLLYNRKVLNYGDIKNLYPTADRREPSREIQLHLTGNMHRYMWSMDGIRFADAEPLLLQYGERVRITLVNDTMMTHPIHLHGVWSELETGDPEYIPRKHTVLVQPGSKISYLVTADARGRWAYHCHFIFHMPGMMREVRIT